MKASVRLLHIAIIHICREYNSHIGWRISNDKLLQYRSVFFHSFQSEHGMLVVHRQPIPLDRFRVHEIGSLEAVGESYIRQHC